MAAAHPNDNRVTREEIHHTVQEFRRKKKQNMAVFRKALKDFISFLVSSSSDNLEELCCGPDLCLDANRMNVEQTHRLPSTNLFERRIIQGHAVFHIGTHVVGWTNLNSLNHFRRHVTRYKSNNESTIASVFFLWYFDSVVGWKKKPLAGLRKRTSRVSN